MAGQIIFDEAAAPATPSSGTVTIYAKTDGSLYTKDDTGSETRLTGDFQLQPIAASVAGNDLTITINPTTLDFRSTTLTTGTPTTVNLASAVSVVVPNTATLGTVNAVAARLAVLAINNSGTIEAAVVNLAGGNQLDETNLITTTTIGTGSDSNNVIYSTTGRTSVAYRVVGFIDITEATAGVWATAPTLVQPTGGQALAALSSLGYGQTWQDVKASRSIGTTYYNTTGKPRSISVNGQAPANTVLALVVGGVEIASSQAYTGSARVSVGGVIPPGASYSCTQLAGTVTVNTWGELS